MTTKSASFIQFRRHVDDLVRAGEFKSPEDPLLYAIKERADREISHRIESWNQATVLPSWDDTQKHLARVFYRADILEPDDYQYLFSALTPRSRGLLLGMLVTNTCAGHDTLSGEPNAWVSKFLQSYSHAHDPLEPSITGAVILSGGLVRLLAVHVPNPLEAAQIHLEIERSLAEKTRPLRMNVELHYLKSAAPSISGSPSDKDLDKWLDEYAIVRELRRENAKEINGKTQVLLIDNHLRYLDGQPASVQPANPELQERRSHEHINRVSDPKRNKVFSELTRSLHEDLDHLIAVMGQKPSAAIQAFGKPQNKSDGERIPGAMTVFSESLEKSLVPADKSRRLIERMLVTLLSVSHKNMATADISRFVDKVKDKVDWKSVVQDLGQKGRAALIIVFDDSKYYREHLPRGERGKVLESELGM